ncbi:MAG TPA: efflux RND transporter periplasmic adaptor subunit, partial [Gemmatimonadales bacterium]|nr:efflux RND transporter periplasmic adaptor subunit [Gemmatimonadales bacterium]
ATVLPGQLVPDEDRTARLGAPAQGRVLTVRVSPGDRVQRGQTLVTLQSPAAGMAQSEVSKAASAVTAKRAQATFSKSARERADRLLALKAIPRQDYEKAVAEEQLAAAELAQAESELQRSRMTAMALGAGDGPTGEIVLRSPQDGVVLERSAVPGAVVEAGAPLAVVTDPTQLWLTINAPETAIGAIKTGASLRFTVPAYPTDTFSARVTSVGAGLDAETRTLPIRAVVSGGAGRLKSAMLASVGLPAGASAANGPGVVLPVDAVQLLRGKSVVFEVMPDGAGGGHFMARTVETGDRIGGRITIVRGIAAGAIVVVQGAFAVKAAIEKDKMPKMEM